MYEYQISRTSRGYIVLILEVTQRGFSTEVDRRIFDFEVNADSWGQRRVNELEETFILQENEDLNEDMLDREYHARGQW